METLLCPKSAVLRRYKSRLITAYSRKIDSVNLEKSLVEKNFQKKINRKEL